VDIYLKNVQFTILVIDDNIANIEVLINALSNEYNVSVALDGKSAMEILGNQKIDLILLDIMMPELDGIQVCKMIKANEEMKEIPIVFLSALDDIEKKNIGLKVGAVDYITKPVDILEVQLKVKNHLLVKKARDILMMKNDALEDIVKERTKQLSLMQDAIINSLAVLAETRDNETGGHIIRTQEYVKLLSDKFQKLDRAKNYNKYIFEFCHKTAPLHDIGKVGIPDSILLKPGKLTKEEFDIMKEHTTIGYLALQKAEENLGKSDFMLVAKEIAYTHHEKWNGSGYPNGVNGEKIPLHGRMMAVADVYDALISKRVYKKPMSHIQALNIIEEGSGSHFDPILVEIFINNQEEFRKIAYTYADYEEERNALSF
jgi:putative two-component system response regulator